MSGSSETCSAAQPPGRSARPRGRFWGATVAAIPFLLVHDAVECAVIVRGAIRYRLLVL